MASEYLTTLADITQLPGLIKSGFLMGHAQARVAFVGRSNVGKSSLINALLKQKIARVSATPGKTRAINFFLWKDQNKIVADLPGYGFALVSKEEQKYWVRLLDHYFQADTHLESVFILFDGRHGPTDQDLDALAYFAEKKIPLQIVMTKMDQLKTQSERAKRKKEVLASLSAFELTEKNLIWTSVKDERSLHTLRQLLK